MAFQSRCDITVSSQLPSRCCYSLFCLPPVSTCPRSEKLEKVVTVDFTKHPAQKVWTRSWAVSTQGSRQVCLSRCPKAWNLPHFAILEKFLQFSQNPGISSGTHEQTPETATAFSSFLRKSPGMLGIAGKSREFPEGLGKSDSLPATLQKSVT